MHISLTPELERLVQEKVQSGLYRDATDVICDALRRMAAHEADDWTLEALKREVSIGAAEAERGEFAEETISDMIATMDIRYPKK